MDVGMMMVYAGYGWENIKVVEKRYPGLDRVVCRMALGTPLPWHWNNWSCSRRK